MSGSGNLSRKFRARHFDTLEVDILHGKEFDLLDRNYLQRLLRQIHQQKFCGVWLGTSCKSLSRARHGKPGSGWPEPLRTKTQPDGVDGFNDKDAEKLKLGNALVEVTVKIIQTCVACRVPVAVENSATSFLWET
eukprot:3487324-Karenia_brevis.AAC.1